MQGIDIINQLLKGNTFHNLINCIVDLLPVGTGTVADTDTLSHPIFCCGVNRNVSFSSNDFTRKIDDIQCTHSAIY